MPIIGQINFFIMFKSILLFVGFIFYIKGIGQTVTDAKGTKISIDSSKWKINGNHLYNKNTGSIGIGTPNPSAQLHTTGSVRFEGINSNTSHSRIITTDSVGNISVRSISNLLSDPITVASLPVFSSTTKGLVPASSGGTNTFLRADGTFGIPSGNNHRSIVYLSTDIINNNAIGNTLEDISGLSFNVVSGVTYRFYAIIPYTSAATNNGSRWTINTPSTSLLHYVSRNTLTSNSETVNYASSPNQPTASNNNSTLNANLAIIEGVIRPSANGSVQIRFASEAPGVAITAKAGATLEYW